MHYIGWGFEIVPKDIWHQTSQEDSEDSQCWIGLIALGVIAAFGAVYYFHSKKEKAPPLPREPSRFYMMRIF